MTKETLTLPEGTVWVPQPIYCAAFGETVDTINRRIANGHWQKGKHYNKPNGSKVRWINLEEVQKWAATVDHDAMLQKVHG